MICSKWQFLRALLDNHNSLADKWASPRERIFGRTLSDIAAIAGQIHKYVSDMCGERLLKSAMLGRLFPAH